MPSHFAPVRVTRACDAGASETCGGETAAIGAPQPGQAAALSETSLPHSAHLMRAIYGAFYAPTFFLAASSFAAKDANRFAAFSIGPRMPGFSIFFARSPS